MTINTVTRSDIFRRAWQIARAAAHRSFGDCLAQAWDEAKGGHLYFWTFLPLAVRFPATQARIEALETEIFLHNMVDTWGTEGLRKASAMQSELRQLREIVAA